MPDISGSIQSCLQALSCLQQSISKQQWQRIPENINHYETEIALFQKACVAQEYQPERFLNDLKYLQTQQRKTMRLLFEAQQHIQENIDTTNQGLHKIQRLSHMAN